MDREGFRNRLKQYKKAREENPGLKYWEWKAHPAEKGVPKYDEGIGMVGTPSVGIADFTNNLVSLLSETATKGFFNTVKRRLYDNLDPYNYDNLDLGERAQDRVINSVWKNKKDLLSLYREGEYSTERDDIFAEYLNIPKENRHKIYNLLGEDISDEKHLVIPSKYKPSKTKNNNVEYKTIDKIKDKDIVESLDYYNNLNFNENATVRNNLGKYFGYYTVGRGLDPKKGEYISVYDLWDINPFYGDWGSDSEDGNWLDKIIHKKVGNKDASLGIGKPIEFYDRVYLNDYYGVDSAPNKGDYYGGYLPEVIVEPKKYDEGGEVEETYYDKRVSTEENPILYVEKSSKQKYEETLARYGRTDLDAYNARKKEASKYTIPYIPEKQIMLTTDRYNTGKISTNLLDSIYDSAQRVGVPIDIALGLAGRESTLGIGRGFKNGQDISMTDLYSNWQQIQPVIATKNMTDTWNNLVKKQKRGELLTDADWAFRDEFLKFGKRALESTRPIKEHPIDNALKLYSTGRYNAGDKRYEQKVQKDAQLIMSDPAIQKWAKEKGITYADGGEVEPDPLEVLERSRPRVAGIPINDRPLSGTDPIGEAVMWGLGGGAASAALRSMFPTYGATAGWLAFGDNNKDNMLVVPNNPTRNTTPIETGLLNKEVRQYYADDVLPRDILTSEADKLRFLNTDKNFEYDLYPSGYFNGNVAGHYDSYADKIRLNGGYTANKDLLDNVMAHEVNHRYNREFPLDKEHNRILNRAYTVQSDLDTRAARAARKPSEKRATNVNIRHRLQTDLRNTLGHNPTKAEMDKFIDSLSDLELLDRLGSASSYGSAYLMSIEDRADLVKQPADQYKKARTTALRKALKRIAMNENKNDNNQNYA